MYRLKFGISVTRTRNHHKRRFTLIVHESDALWLVLVMILGASLLVVLVPNDEPALVNEDLEEEETTDENTCLVGTEKVLNVTALNGYDCVPLDPHSMFHTHPLPFCP